MTGYIDNIEEKTINNDYFREVVFTGKYCQLVVMCLKPSEEIGSEVHRSVDLVEEGSLLKDKIEKVFGSITTVFCQLLEDLRTKFIGLEFVNFKPIQIRLSSPP